MVPHVGTEEELSHTNRRRFGSKPVNARAKRVTRGDLLVGQNEPVCAKHPKTTPLHSFLHVPFERSGTCQAFKLVPHSNSATAVALQPLEIGAASYWQQVRRSACT